MDRDQFKRALVACVERIVNSNGTELEEAMSLLSEEQMARMESWSDKTWENAITEAFFWRPFMLTSINNFWKRQGESIRARIEAIHLQRRAA